MAKEFAKAFYKSHAWQACRDAYVETVGGLCERCLRRGEVTAGEIVHHKIALTPKNINNPSVTLNFANLELVCQTCHNKAHGKSESRYEWTEMGDIKPPRSQSQTPKGSTGGC